MKLKWKVAPVPTGRYRSFEQRGWPDAHHADGRVAAMIRCKDEYMPDRVATGKHAELEVWVAQHFPREEWLQKSAFKWRRLSVRATTLREAKLDAEDFLVANPHFWEVK